ncbi:MAG: ECF-type sigma factor [Bacteroidales bacterium]|nr:ECF-type sigma factor [Bacteroidales bacterium]
MFSINYTQKWFLFLKCKIYGFVSSATPEYTYIKKANPLFRGTYNIEDINKAIILLDTRDKMLVGMILSGFTKEEIAKKTNVTSKTLKKNISFVKKQIQNNLNQLTLQEVETQKKKEIAVSIANANQNNK